MLPAISRLVERLLSYQLKAHVRLAGVLLPFQHGFRAGHSCEHALLELIDTIAMKRAAGEHVCVVSLDLASAFDTLDHDILLEKLENNAGITGAALSLFRSYLRRTVEKARNAMDVALDEFLAYSTANRLAPQPSKTQLMICTSTQGQTAAKDIACTLAGMAVKPAETIKILGVLLDQQMTWEPHAAAAAGRADSALHQIRRNARWLTTKERAHLAQALALPHLDYCQSALASPTKSATETLTRAYNRAARVSARMERKGFRRRAPLPTERSEPALRTTKWPTWARRRVATAAALALPERQANAYQCGERGGRLLARKLFRFGRA
eukprot:gene17820-biopygen38860